MRSGPIVAASALALVACAGGPAPREPTPSLTIHNTAAEVENQHAVTEVDDSAHAREVLAQPDRSAEDRALDAARQAGDVLTYLDVRPGMKVAELAAGGGYFAELLARAVAPGGTVLAVNPPALLDRAGVRKAWDDRLARSAGRIVGVDEDLGRPLPGGDLDLVYLAYFHGDLRSIGVDPAAVDSSAFVALRHGGRYVVLDRRPPVTTGGQVSARALHTEASRNARRQIEAAGFQLVSEGRFLRHSTDPRDWNAVPTSDPTPLETQDRFLLTFVKP